MSVAGLRTHVDTGREGMYPSIRERLGLGEAAHPSADSRADRGLMARSLMYLFAAGGAVSLGSLVISPAGIDAARIAVTGACSFAIALMLLVAYGRIPLWGFQALLACGTLLIEWSVY